MNLQRLQEQRDDGRTAWEQLVGACRKTKDAINGMADRKETLAARAAEEAGKPATVPDGEREYLDKVYARLRPPASADAIAAFSEDFRAQLERCRRDAEQDQRVAAAEIQAAISVFTSRWPDSVPDSSGDVGRCGADFAALHEEITRRRLPEAMHRFQTMISEDMVPSVSVLYRTIETASHRDPPPRRHGQRRAQARRVQPGHPPADRRERPPVRVDPPIPRRRRRPAQERPRRPRHPPAGSRPVRPGP